MEDKFKYSALWQHKRDELPVDGDPNMDWQTMQNLLDQHLPVTQGGGNAGNGAGGSNAGMGSGLVKLLAVLAITVPAAVALYFLVHNGAFTGKKQRTGKHDSVAAINPKTDSLATVALAAKKKLTAYDDSISHVQQQVIAANNALNTLSGADKRTTTTNDSIAIIKQQLATAQASLTRLQAAKAAVVAHDKQAAANYKAGNGAATSSMVKGNVRSSITNKQNIPNGTIGNRGHATATVYGAMSARKNDANSTANGYRPAHSSRGSGYSKPAGITGNAISSPKNNNGPMQANNRRGSGSDNSLLGNSGHTVSHANDKDSPKSINDDTEMLTAISGYHPDAGVFGSMAAPGNYPFINAPRGSDMRLRGRVFANGGNSKISVDKPGKPKKEKKVKAPRDSGDRTASFDWGLLIGANTNGSFTGKSQNANIYGSWPVDAYTGLFGTYHFNNNFGLNVQLWLYNPQNISGGYSHANGSKVDSGKVIQVTDSRKAYFVNVPIHAVYQITDNLAVKLGPVINLPVKQINGSTSLTPATISKDSTYYKKTISQLNATKYQQQISFGLSGGLQFSTGRLSIEATYLKNLGGYKVSSDYGTYTASPGALQFTVGFRLNRAR